MKTVKNKESDKHSGCQHNALWSHEFWVKLVSMCLGKSVSEKYTGLFNPYPANVEYRVSS
jgi:hypothetical protein